MKRSRKVIFASLKVLFIRRAN